MAEKSQKQTDQATSWGAEPEPEPEPDTLNATLNEARDCMSDAASAIENQDTFAALEAVRMAVVHLADAVAEVAGLN